MRLWIAEKPSMGRAIAEALPGPRQSRDGHIETAAGTVTWAIGHLLHPALPEDYDPAHKQWCLEQLPILPDQWQLKVSPRSQKQSDLIRGLLMSAQSVVHAGDAGREGQLIIQELLDHYGYGGPVQRLWLSALDPESLNRALGNLKDNNNYLGLHAAALARQRADWLVGINLTRLYTLHFSAASPVASPQGRAQVAAQQVFSIGRVQTPTLRLIIDRERQIAGFKPVKYYTPKTELQTSSGKLTASFKLRDSDDIASDPEDRIIAAAEAERIRAAAAGGPAIVQAYEAKDKAEPAPLPYSLDALQIDANKIHDFTAARTLEIAQGLYEKHKLISYPRSDCRYLPHSQHQDAGAIIAGLAVKEPFSDWLGLANSELCGRVFNDKKLSEHHAIIPTRVCGKRGGLSEDESKLFNLIARAYLAQFLTPHRYKAQKASLLTGGYLYTATARSVSDIGWKIILGQDTKDGDPAADHDDDDNAGNAECAMPDLVPGQHLPVIDSYLKDSLTKAPPRFSDASLIAAMTSIHKYVADSGHKKQLKETDGIGTPATRAAIIENLVARKFVGRQGKAFHGLAAGMILIDAVADRIKDPALTALFESRLRLMEDGKMGLALFQAMVEKLISKAIEEVKGGKVAMDRRGDLMPQTIKGQTIKGQPIKGQAIKGTGKPCPVCKTGQLVTRSAKTGKNKGRRFLGCDRFARTGCKYVERPGRTSKQKTTLNPSKEKDV